MRSANSSLVSLLNSGTQFLIADLYTIVLSGGTTYRYSGTDVTLSDGTYLYASLPMQRNSIKESVGIQVSELELDMYPDPNLILGGLPVLQAINVGVLDGARVSLYRGYFTSWVTPCVGTLLRFSGRVAQAKLTRTSAKVTVASDLKLLDVQLPRNLYMPTCVHTLYDSGCALTKASFAVNGTVAGGSTSTVINTGATQADGYFSLGTIQFTSGVNNGAVRSVKSFAHSGGAFTLSIPVTPPGSGDTFTAYPGCDKLSATCTNKFNNLANFRGYEFVPVPEMAF